EDLFQLARSQENFARFHEWEGDFGGALKHHEQRADLLQKCPPDAPLGFQDDLCDSLVAIAELRMLVRADFDRQESLELLQRARSAWKADKGLQERILVARGKCNARSRPHEARQDLEKAVGLYGNLIHEAAAQVQDHYRLAIAHALLARLNRDPKASAYHEHSAEQCLDYAVNKGYRLLKKVEREEAFGRALRARARFQSIFP